MNYLIVPKHDGTDFAVYKSGSRRAVKKFPTFDEAAALAQELAEGYDPVAFMKPSGDVKWQPIPNINSVSKRQWKKWEPEQQLVFNRVYRDMASKQVMLGDHFAKECSDEAWTTLRWNAAFVAACAAPL
jgi:hypothetical protein